MANCPRYKIITYGCQMNKSDSERIGGLLQKIGLVAVDKSDDADLIIVNTCSVRQTAEDRVYGQMKNFARLKKKKPRLLIGVTGCIAGRDKDGAMRRKMPFIDFIFNISDLPRLPEMIFSRWHKIVCRQFGGDITFDYLGIKPKATEWWRGRVIVQTGCSNYCTYCVVPYARGHEKNRPVKEILAEARAMAVSGAKEIILLGQAVNKYSAPDRQNFSENNPFLIKRDDERRWEDKFSASKNYDFATLLWEINQIGGINRIGFASAHPMYLTDSAIKALKLPKMVNFLHLPVQSGNNEILRHMNRGYTREDYLKIIAQVKKSKSDIALATDIIVGFSGETKKQFKDTVSLFKKCDFDMSYTAMYSPRIGTAAYGAFKDDVPQKEKRRRWLVLQKMMEKNSLRKNKKFIGKVAEVLVDGCADNKCWGLSRENKRVVFSGNKKLVGQIVNVRIEKAREWELAGSKANPRCPELGSRESQKPRLVVILGPTASGKTNLAIKLAKRFNGEIVNADSRAIYKEMKIATAVPKKYEDGVRHHLINFIRPDEDFSLAEYKKLAVEKINDILRRGKVPFLVGGTRLYISAVVDNFDIPNVAPDRKLREKLYKLPPGTLYGRLRKQDPEAAAKIHPNDKRRIVRALEVIYSSKQKISSQQRKGEPLFNVLRIGIRRNLDEIEKRARGRIKKEMGEKLVRETKKLLRKYSPELPAMSSLGYREIGEYLRGNISREDAFALLVRNTRRFARYQLNTFRKDKKVKWVSGEREAAQKIKLFLK